MANSAERTGQVVRPGVVLAIVCTGAVLATLDLFIVNIAFPSIERSFEDTKLATLSWVLNAYAIVFAALIVPAGRLADRSGRKQGFLFGVAVFTAASGLCAAANGVWLLVVARVFQAAGAALLVPSSLGLLLAAYPAERRAAAVRIWAAMAGLSAAIGPVVGGILVSASWRWIFLVNLPVGIGALVVGRRWLPAPSPEREPLPDLLGALTLMLGVGAVTLGLVKAPDWGWGSPATIGSFAASVVLLLLFTLRSAQHERPVLELDLLRVRSFAMSSLASLIFSVSFAAMLLSVILWTQTAWGWSALKAGLAFAPGPLMVPLLAIGAGRAVGRIGGAAVSAVGSAIFAAGALWWIVAAGRDANYLSGMLPGALLTGTGVGLTVPTLTAVAATSLPVHRFATGSAVIGMTRQVGFALGVALLIAVLGTPRSPEAQLTAFHHGWEMIAASAGLAAAAAVFIQRRAPAAEPAEAVTETAS
jgi:EmrB/QacA subfamily drug resistance transporter